MTPRSDGPLVGRTAPEWGVAPSLVQTVTVWHPSASARRRSLKAQVPWYAKLGAKMVLSRLPVPDRAWHRIGIFDPGAMDDPKYAISVLLHHLERSGSIDRVPRGTAMEIGPGKSLASAVSASAAGFSRIYLVDVAPLASTRPRALHAVADYARMHGWDLVRVSPKDTVEAVLKRTGTSYLTDGLRSLRSVPDASVDFIWSQAVLEHVWRHEFPEFIAELFRILRPNGVSSHTVDLADHLGNSLNNLRFTTRVWESRWMRESGFYTNRLRRSQIVKLCELAGFNVIVPSVEYWHAPPLPRKRLAPEFANSLSATSGNADLIWSSRNPPPASRCDHETTGLVTREGGS